MINIPKNAPLLTMTLIDNIWFTYKSRIAAENRLKSNDFHSQALLVWYALISAIGAIAGIVDSSYLGPKTSFLSALMAVALLVLSLWVTNQDWRGRAIRMRENHLQLMHLKNKLSAEGVSSEDAADKYHQLLCECENHTGYDFDFFRVFDSGVLKSNNPSAWEFIKTYLKRFFRFIVLMVFYILPFFIYLWFSK